MSLVIAILLIAALAASLLFGPGGRPRPEEYQPERTGRKSPT